MALSLTQPKTNELRDNINDLRKPNFEHRYYVPEQSLNNTVSQSVIEGVLRETSLFQPHEVDDLVYTIHNGLKKIFSILVLNNHVQYIKAFIEGDQLQASQFDHKLPLDLERLSRLMPRNHARIFHEKQWEFTVPIFSESVLHRQLADETILPFISEEKVGQGGFGVVHRVGVDSEHNHYGSTFKELVRKELQPCMDEYEVELGNLSSLKLLQNPNLIRLLGSYTYRNKHNLIFPEAKEGSLAAFLKHDRSPHFHDDKAYFLALGGLASAIEEVHSFTVQSASLSKIGAHHDLRPANILVDGNQFLLADFGLARFKDSTETSETVFEIGQGYCLAPECQSLREDFKRHSINRSSDVWSFGCIIADVITHMVRGPGGIDEFRRRRRFQISTNVYFYFHAGDKENDGVSLWLAELEKSTSESGGMIITLIRKMLNMDPSLRPTAKEVAYTLRFIALHSFAAGISRDFMALQGQEVLPLMLSDVSILYVENMRFLAWRKILRLSEGFNTETLAQINFDSGWFRSTIERLQILEQEFQSIRNQPFDTRRRVLMPLRNLNSQIYTSVPESLQGRLRNETERLILGTDDLQLLKELHRVQIGGSQALIGAKIATISIKNLPPSQRVMELNRRPALTSHHLGHHDIGNMNDLVTGKICKVLIEHKLYIDPLLREGLFERMEAIAKLSDSIPDPNKVRILRCRGYYHDADRFAFSLVYDFPGAQCSVTAISLQQLLKDPRRESQPSLGDRFRLGYLLAAALFDFHKIGWLHKGLSSSNVAFFYGSDINFHESLLSPYIVGFRHSRPHELVTFTEGPPLADGDDKYYQHPEYIRDNDTYTFKHDYYSLGIVLLELGLWKPLMKMGKLSGLSIEGFRQQLVDTVVPRLGQSMGTTFRDVVNAMLGWEFDDDKISDKTVTPKVQSRFETTVLSKLRTLAAHDI